MYAERSSVQGQVQTSHISGYALPLQSLLKLYFGIVNVIAVRNLIIIAVFFVIFMVLSWHAIKVIDLK